MNSDRHSAVPVTAEAILTELDARRILQALHGPDPTPNTEPVAWEEPIPLAGRRHLPVFPVSVLPTWVADMVAAVAEETQTPPDLAGSIALAALSTAAGGRAEVDIRGSWREPVNLYILVALPPGSRKSAVFKAITAPILATERALVEQARPAIIEADLARRVAERAAEKAATNAANAHADADADARNELLAEASTAAMHADAITVPIEPRLVADDITAEATASLLAVQGGRLAILSAEGGIFTTLAGRYSGTPNLDVFLKGHAGEMLRVDRKGRPAEYIERAHLTLGLAVQPGVLRALADLPGFRDRGLLARILYSLPENTVGRRRIGAPAVPSPVAETYARGLAALVCSLVERTESAVLPLTPEANARVFALEEEVEPRLGPTGPWAHIVDWGSKYVGAVVRLAGLIHLAKYLHDGWGRPIDAGTIDRAAALGRYYASHALAAFDDMGADRATDNARAALDWIERTQPEQFTKRDLFRALQSRVTKATELDPVLSLLEAHGLIRPAPTSERAGRGRRPSPTYLVNPAVLGPGAVRR